MATHGLRHVRVLDCGLLLNMQDLFIYFQITFDELQAKFTRLLKPGQDPKYIEKVESYKQRNDGDGEAGPTSAKRKTR